MKLDVYYNDIDAYCCKVLAKNIERGNLPQGEIDNADIRTVDLVRLRQYRHVHLYAGIGGFPYGFSLASVPTSISILTAGFPCQPFSLAGKQKGTSDDRYLWPITLDAIRALRPQYAVLENVASLLTTERGTVFSRILSDLAESGYDAEWQVLRASDFDAPHQRARVWIVAHAHRAACGLATHRNCGQPRQPANALESAVLRQKHQEVGTERAFTGGPNVANTHDTRLEGWHGEIMSKCAIERLVGQGGTRDGRLSNIWKSEPAVGRVANGIPNRMDRLKGCGNAIVPQIAAYIGECIKTHAFS